MTIKQRKALVARIMSDLSWGIMDGLLLRPSLTAGVKIILPQALRYLAICFLGVEGVVRP